MSGEIEAAQTDEAGFDPPMRVRLVIARILRLLSLLRLSAAITYQHRTGFVESHRRLLTLVANYGGLTSGELVGISGNEKAQVSRTIGMLTRSGLVRREKLRARIELTPEGVAAFDRILAVAHARNADLTQGIAAEDLARFGAGVIGLTERAIAMLASEREVSPPIEKEASMPMPQRLRLDDPERPMAPLITPPLITLVAYLQRSAALVYRRETGLSTFQWQVMSQIGEYAPMPLLRLVEIIGRDKSQVGRTVARLDELGLVTRASVPGGGRTVMLDVTAAGRNVYATMCRIAIAREDILFAGFSSMEHDRFVATVAALTANAERVLVEARAADAA